MRDVDYLKKALKIEKDAKKSAERCLAFYADDGNPEMTAVMKAMVSDEIKHVEKIEAMLNKLQK